MIYNETKHNNINPTMTFENFIVGETNRFAYTMAKQLIEEKHISYNPLLIYSKTGLGKTHLLHAIGNVALSQKKQVIYTTTENFTNIFISHIRNKIMPRFREHFRSCDVLLMDDIHDLNEKEETQKEFFHTFEKLHMEGKQIVMASNRAPKDMKNIADRLISRFVWGMVVDMQQPNTIMKKKMIEQLCQQNYIQMDNASMEYLTQNVGDSYRSIEGILVNINALSILHECMIDMNLVKKVIKEHTVIQKKQISIEAITHIVAKECHVKVIDISSKKRNKTTLKARQIVIFLAKEIGLLGAHQLVYHFDYKSISSISRSVTRVYKLMEKDESYKILIDRIIKKVKELENG